MESKLKVLNRNHLKYIAIVAMMIDHIAWAFVPTASVLGQIMHFIGRITGPMMAFFLAEGFIHTRDRGKYGIRLFVFALISWIPYSIFETGKWPSPQLGVIYTLFLGFLAMYVWSREDINTPSKITLVVILCLASLLGDWPIFDVLWPLFFYIYRDDPKKKWTAYYIIVAFEVGCCLVAS